ncbi:efflux RND transporter periplasmic adaptor subunit [Burkholderia cepacia]|uniref:efflux RND transporter periplasmic adaptor subunit n=1 Tax=Burkholderia cepacia TaxID=292 RepID=UPI001CF20E15|nr:efflux RND transporter periplasmic adaptor subunit [Burkholderia cepacia]MCA7936950.1 efflux RND transporter periplasmic adaptor subunit [Burkholderia cepacia]MDN7634719.1 efflux RND transporter periplasmic adaptor subunit [Burkholderia cepacia]
MSTEIEIKSPKRLPNLKLVATIAALVAVGIVTAGIAGRAHAKQEMTRWSAEQAVPTVVAYTPTTGGDGAALVLPGHLSAFESAPIHAQVSGYLRAWYTDIGAHVKSGQLLGLIDTPELDQQLQQARADLQSSLANEKLAASTAARWTRMLAQDSVSQQETDEKTSDLAAKQAIVAANEANVRRLDALEAFKRIVAPFDGVVTARKTDIGQLISAGGGAGPELFAVSDVHRMRVYVSVPQNEAAAIRPGMSATLTVPEHPDETFHATLADTDDSIADSTGTLLVQLMVDNRDGKLIPGEYTEVHFALPAGSSNALTIPASSLIFRQAGLQVAVVGKDDRAVLKPVTIATDLGTHVQIATGLAPDDRVIDNPPDSLSAGDRVRLATPAGTIAAAVRDTERANG